MGCITSTQPKLNNAIKTQTVAMLQRSVALNDELRIIIDDDRYKPIQNTIPQRNYVELSHSHSSSTYSVSPSSREVSVSSSMDIIENRGVTLMGFESNDMMNVEHSVSQMDRNEDTQSSEASLIHTGCITLMGIADSNQIFIHSNHDLDNKIVLPNNDEQKDDEQTQIKHNTVTPSCC